MRGTTNLLTLVANMLLCAVFVVMALARLQLLLFVVSGFAGIAWTLAASELWVAAQRSMPEWARGRLSAVHMMSSQGGMALGAIAWGTLVTWQLQQDLENPTRFRMEMLVASWSEHLRQHERMTNFELKTWETAASYHLDGEPVPVQHFLSIDREVLLLGQTAK